MKIDAVDLSGGNLEIIWERPNTAADSSLKPREAIAKNSTAAGMIERNSSHRSTKLEQRDKVDRCYSPDQLQAWFGDVPW